MDTFNRSTCRPLECLDDVLNWNSENIKRKYKIKKLILNEQNAKSTNKLKIILCHDMKNNYLEDKYYQGINIKNGYRFFNWNLIEYFIYFSHHFITIPTESWINAAHKNNVPILGTLITEGEQGFNLCERLLSNVDLIEKFIQKLVDITLFYDFDGWLLNIENKIRPELVGNLIDLSKKLTDRLRAIDSRRYKIIWYDSVIHNGDLKWQNELNDLNECFFNVTDAIFMNYTWKQNNLLNSKQNAKTRLNDVYIGVDVFGRGVFGGGGFNCNLAFNEINNVYLNAALFAPGWVLETNDEKNFLENELKFWCLLEPYAARQELSRLPLVCTFNQGCGENFFVNGKLISGNSDWYNLNLQTLFPASSNKILFDSEKYPLRWCFNDAYYGGSCIEIDAKTNINLFDLNIKLNKDEVIKVRFVFKTADSIDCKNVYLILEHFTDETKVFPISNDEKDLLSAEFELLSYKSDELLKQADWITREYSFKVNKHLVLNKLDCKNESDSAVKIGLVSVLPVDVIEDDFNSYGRISDIKIKNSNCIRLDNRYYFVVEIEWDFTQVKENFGYFDVYLKSTSDGLVKYIGSTTCQNYYLCLELDNFYFNYSKSSDYNTEANKHCQLMIQYVNEYYELDGFKADVSTINVELPGRATIKRVIYDFEYIF